jgi:hypothetical protein
VRGMNYGVWDGERGLIWFGVVRSELDRWCMAGIY